MFPAKVRICAKVNLSLNISGTSGGMHLIDTVVAPVDIYDTVCAKPRADTLVNVYMHGRGSESIPPEANNAVKAGEAFVAAFGTRGADIEIYKDIPMGAGLGGSSADAAGVLNALAKLYKIKDRAKLKELADTLGLPAIIHSRDAAADTLQLLKDNRGKLAHGGVMHCFSGSPETAKEYLKLGLYISFAGPVTFKNARRLDEVAKTVPADRILAETDSPYLAPEPFRGTRNTPKNVVKVYEKLAALRGEETEALAERIEQNARALFTKLGEETL